MIYHFCDGAAWGEYGELADFCNSEGRYDELQRIGFAIAFFMIAMGNLFFFLADIQPAFVRLLLYGAGQYYTFSLMADERRWFGGQMLFCKYVLGPSVVLHIGRHVYRAYRVGGVRQLGKLAAMKRLGIALGVIGIGFSTRLF